MKKKILIGHAERINQNGAVKCGGAVARQVKTIQVVSLENMNLKMMRKMMIKLSRNLKKS